MACLTISLPLVSIVTVMSMWMEFAQEEDLREHKKLILCLYIEHILEVVLDCSITSLLFYFNYKHQPRVIYSATLTTTVNNSSDYSS